MKATTYTNLRARLKMYCDQVADSGESLVIQRRGGADVALVSMRELSALEETAHLLRSPENARRLFAARDEVRKGGGTKMTPEELRRHVGLSDGLEDAGLEEKDSDA